MIGPGLHLRARHTNIILLTKFIFLWQRAHFDRYNLDFDLDLRCRGCHLHCAPQFVKGEKHLGQIYFYSSAPSEFEYAGIPRGYDAQNAKHVRENCIQTNNKTSTAEINSSCRSAHKSLNFQVAVKVISTAVPITRNRQTSDCWLEFHWGWCQGFSRSTTDVH